MIKKGEKYIITDGVMRHLIGKVCTIKEFKCSAYNKDFYEVTIDDMNDCPLVCSERVLKKFNII